MPYHKPEKQRVCLDDILTAFALISLVATIIYMVGIAGSVETDAITLAGATKRFIVAIVILAVDVLILWKTERDEEGEYDRL
jgi:hypothetical protein